MKKSNLVTGVVYVIVCMILLLIAILTDSKLSGLLFGFASGGIVGGLMMICRYFYWNKPENKERYQMKLENEKIEYYDELKTKLRDRAGRYAYGIGLVTVSVSIVVFDILDELEIVDDSRLIVLYLGGYLIFQIVMVTVIFSYLSKKYE